jgi:hypothetical protein
MRHPNLFISNALFYFSIILILIFSLSFFCFFSHWLLTDSFCQYRDYTASVLLFQVALKHFITVNAAEYTQF